MNKPLKSRLFSGFLAAAMAATSLVLPTTTIVSAANVVTSLKGGNETDDVTLLKGSNTNSTLHADTVEGVVNNANSQYALGIASQFCVFTFENFEPSESDAEGRVAVGGDFVNNTAWGSYAVGKGDFLEHTSLEKLEGNSGFAHVILNGELKKGKLSDSYYDEDEPMKGDRTDGMGEGVEGEKKIKIININKSSLPDVYDLTQIPESDGPGKYQKIDQQHTYVSNLIDFEATKNLLIERSITLSEKEDQFEVSKEGETITLKYTGSSSAKTVYCKLDAAEQEMFKSAKYIKYENIPETVERQIVNNKGGMDTWNAAYIVINVEGSTVTVANNDVFTYINDTLISKNWNGEANGSYKELIPDFEGDFVDNNHPGVSSLLYNYYEANDVALGKNFQGTIFAPNAYVHDGVNGRGHLSGALIANKFSGGTEFGYRPFTGPISMIGNSAGYNFPVLKVDSSGNALKRCKNGLI